MLKVSCSLRQKENRQEEERRVAEEERLHRVRVCAFTTVLVQLNIWPYVGTLRFVVLIDPQQRLLTRGTLATG